MTYDPNDPRLTAYALDELDDADRPDVEAQLAACAESRRTVDDIRATAQLLSQQLHREPSPGLTAIHFQAIEGQLSQPQAPTNGRPRFRWLTVALAASFLGAAGALLLARPFDSKKKAPAPEKFGMLALKESAPAASKTAVADDRSDVNFAPEALPPVLAAKPKAGDAVLADNVADAEMPRSRDVSPKRETDTIDAFLGEGLETNKKLDKSEKGGLESRVTAAPPPPATSTPAHDGVDASRLAAASGKRAQPSQPAGAGSPGHSLAYNTRRQLGMTPDVELKSSALARSDVAQRLSERTKPSASQPSAASAPAPATAPAPPGAVVASNTPTYGRIMPQAGAGPAPAESDRLRAKTSAAILPQTPPPTEAKPLAAPAVPTLAKEKEIESKDKASGQPGQSYANAMGGLRGGGGGGMGGGMGAMGGGMGGIPGGAPVSGRSLALGEKAKGPIAQFAPAAPAPGGRPMLGRNVQAPAAPQREAGLARRAPAPPGQPGQPQPGQATQSQGQSGRAMQEQGRPGPIPLAREEKLSRSYAKKVEQKPTLYGVQPNQGHLSASDGQAQGNGAQGPQARAPQAPSFQYNEAQVPQNSSMNLGVQNQAAPTQVAPTQVAQNRAVAQNGAVRDSKVRAQARDGKPQGREENQLALVPDEAKDARGLQTADKSRLDLETAPLSAVIPAPEPAKDELFERIDENPFHAVLDQPRSTFSIDVDTASYSIVRRFLNQNQRPPADAVRIEELINYFPYHDPAPTGDDPFSISVEVGRCPWQPANRLARISLKAREIPNDKRPASNLVFLVDVSGSMIDANKLPLLKSGLRLLVDQLRENDRVAIVSYADDVRNTLACTSGTQKAEIHSSLDQLEAAGSTNGSGGIQRAYDQCVSNFIPGGTNRVILCTDGDFNVGITNDADLTRMIEQKAKSNVFLSVLGFGMGNLKDAKMEKLADRGNGQYAYIDSLQEARKALVEQMGGTLVTVAKDVKIQVEFNPAKVSAYRLIGYEDRQLQNQDFNNDAKDAGEIGAGLSVTALYELVPAGKEPARPATDPLKFQKPGAVVPSNESLFVRLRYKKPEGDQSLLIERSVVDEGKDDAHVSDDFKFAAAVASFGMQLRGSSNKGNATLAGVLELAEECQGPDTGGYRKEFLDLVRKAQTILGH
ncbi:MAG TPA: VWA domain-containing protein [Isosphaeraceae bacterium]|jgi:Ca-activated chloride channel family protein|nr:VWA domain-containing protein [Isosphaeraceae bacterium]